MVANPERGEVELKIGDATGVICAQMAGLAALSSKIGTPTLSDLFVRIQGVEPMTMYHIIDCLIVDGDAKDLKLAIKTPVDLSLVSAAAMKSLSAFVSEKKPEGGPETP